MLDAKRVIRYHGRIDDQYTIGFRKDKLDIKTVDAIRDPVTNFWTVNHPDIEPVYQSFAGTTKTLGAVGHVTRNFSVFYNRSNEAAAQLKPGDFDWNAIFAGGARWFHSGGIFAALSETTGDVIIESMQAAKAAGAIVSFDLNYRAKLWNIWGGQEKAASTLTKIVENVDVLVGNEEDLQMGLGFPGPEVESKSKLDPSAFCDMIGKVVDKFPQIKVIATTLREVHSTNHHSWSAVAWIDGQTYQAPTCELNIYDRVGGGDGFASGFFYGLLAGEPEEAAVKLGWAHGALLTSYPGDTTMATVDQVRAFAKGGSARIQR